MMKQILTTAAILLSMVTTNIAQADSTPINLPDGFTRDQNTTFNNGTMSHTDTITGPKQNMRQGFLTISQSTAGGTPSISHDAIYSSLIDGDTFHMAKTVVYGDNSGIMIHTSQTTGKNEYTRGGFTRVEPNSTTGNSDIYHNSVIYSPVDDTYYRYTETTSDGAGNIAHSSSLETLQVQHEGSTHVDSSDSITHSGSITGPSGSTHEGTTTLVPSTSGGKPTINHEGSFGNLFAPK